MCLCTKYFVFLLLGNLQFSFFSVSKLWKKSYLNEKWFSKVWGKRKNNKKKKINNKYIYIVKDKTVRVMKLYHTYFLPALLSLCYSGHETKAMMNNSGPRYKRSQLEKRLNTDVLWCVLLLIIMCLTAAIGVHQHWHHTILTSLHSSRIFKNNGQAEFPY